MVSRVLLVVTGLFLGISLLLVSIVSGPLQESQLLRWALYFHLLGALVLLLFYGVLKRKQFVGVKSKLLKSTGLQIPLVILITLLLICVVRIIPAYELDFSSYQRFQLSPRLLALLQDERISSLSLIIFEDSAVPLSAAEEQFVDSLVRSRIPNTSVSREQVLLSPTLSMKQGLRPEHKALLKLSTEGRTLEVALAQPGEESFLQVLAPLFEKKRRVMLAGAETGSRIDSSDLDGFADLKAFGVERNIDFVPAGQALDSLDALLVVHQPDDQDQALESLLLQAQDLGLPTMLLCEPSSCRSKELQSNLGLEIGETILIDRMPAVGGGARYGVTLVLDRFVSHPMFFSGKPPRSLFTHGVTTLKPISEMGSSSNAFEKWSAVLLASDTAWGETGLSSAGGVDKQVIALDSEDHVGELILAATRLAPAPLFVIGDSTWLTNQFLTRNSNSELLLRAIDWLTGVTEKTQTAPASTSVLAVKDFEYFLLLALLVPEAIFITLLFFMFAKESFD